MPKLSAAEATLDTFSKAYAQHWVVLVKGVALEDRLASRRKRLGLGCLRKLYAAHAKMVEATFTSEVPARKRKVQEESRAEQMLGRRRPPAGRWYCSFVVQKRRAALSSLLREMPFRVPPFLARPRKAEAGSAPAPRHSNAMWVFFGSNPGTRPLHGRPEHTDAIAHSGTWHLQMHGKKVWKLRPTAELMRSCPALRKAGQLRVCCGEGDVLVVNTRLWRHCTFIPSRCPLSMSLARDLWLDSGREQSVDMVNQDGLFARSAIRRHQVIFTEEDAPDLALPRSRGPEANVALTEAGGLMVAVARKPIQPGEWLVMYSSDEEE